MTSSERQQILEYMRLWNDEHPHPGQPTEERDLEFIHAWGKEKAKRTETLALSMAKMIHSQMHMGSFSGCPCWPCSYVRGD
jgi:hypothetical protein